MPPASLLPKSYGKETRELKADVYIAVSRWLETHGKHVKVRISEKQRADADAAFKLMDTDGSGKLDIKELEAAFNLLGLGLDKRNLRALMNGVDTDKSGLLEIDEFLALMTESLTRKLEEDMPMYTLPFPLLSSQYRRKRYLEGLMAGDESTLHELVNISDRQQHEHLKHHENPKKIELEQAAQVIQDNVIQSEERKEKEMMEMRKKAESKTTLGKAVLRISQMNKLDEGLLSSMTQKELALLVRAADKRFPPENPSVMQTPRPASGITKTSSVTASPRPRSKPSTPRDLLNLPSGHVPPLSLRGLLQSSPRPDTARSRIVTPRDEQLLDMPQTNIPLVFTRSVIGSRPTSGISHSSQGALAEWVQAHQRQQSSPRMQPAIRVRGNSALSSRSAGTTSQEAAREAVDIATSASSIMGSMTPRSARQKGLDYAMMMERERSLQGVRQISPRMNAMSRSFSSRPSPRHSAPHPSLNLMGLDGSLDAVGMGISSKSMTSPRAPQVVSPRPSSAIPPSSSSSSPTKLMPTIPLLQLSKLSLSKRSPRSTSPKA